MKLGILCTMINVFGRRGYYNSQEVGRAGCRDEGIVLLWRPAAFSAPHLPLVQKTRGGIRTLHRHGTQPE